MAKMIKPLPIPYMGISSELRITELPRHYLDKSDLYGCICTVRVVCVLFGIVAFTPVIYSEYGALSLIALMPLLGAYIYKLTIIMHDCAHGTLFREARLNIFLGRLGGALTASDFSLFKKNHLSHHRHYGTDKDPEGYEIMQLAKRSSTERLRYLLKPLLGLSALQVLQAHHGQDQDRSQTKLPIIEILLAQLAILLIITRNLAIPELIAVYPFSAATLALFFSRTRGFCEHVSFSIEHIGVARSHRPRLLDRLFFYTMNMNYHLEHHLYPSIPSERLPEVQKLIGNKTVDPNSYAGSIIDTVIRGCKR
jgi:fatty acid desaturase